MSQWASTREYSFIPKDQLYAYLKANPFFSLFKYKNLSVPYILISPLSIDIVPDTLLYAGIKLNLDIFLREKNIQNQNTKSSNLDKLLDSDAQIKSLKDKKEKLLKLIRKLHENALYKADKIDYSILTKEENKLFQEFQKIGEQFKKDWLEKFLKYYKEILNKIEEDIFLTKKEINVYSLQKANSNPEIVFAGFKTEYTENFDNLADFKIILENIKHFLHKDYVEYISSYQFDTSKFTNYEIRYLLSHSLPLNANFVGVVAGNKLYAIHPKNFDKKFTDKEIYERFYEKLKELNSEEEDLESLKLLAKRDFETFYSKPMQLTKEYHNKYFKEVFNAYKSFYRQNFGKEPLQNIVYERFKTKKDKEFSINNVKFFLNFNINGFLLIVEKSEDLEILRTSILNFSNTIKRYEDKFSTGINKLVDKNKFYENLLFIRWKDLLTYFDKYKDNEKFSKIIKENAIEFLYDTLFAVNSIFVIATSGKIKRVPIFFLDIKGEENLDFFEFFNAYNYLISNYPFQTIKKETIQNKKFNQATAKNFFLSMFKNQKKLEFNIKNQNITKKIEGILAIEEYSNMVISDYISSYDPNFQIDENEEVSELDKKHRILHFYRFSVEKDQLSLEYQGNSIKLSNFPLETNKTLKLKEKDFLIAVAESLSKEEIKKLLSETFSTTVQENRFNYIRYYPNVPFIRKYTQNKKETRAYFLLREEAGDLRPVIDEFLGKEAEVGKSLAIIYTPPNQTREFPFFASHSSLYLIYHLEELKDIIEKILFAYNVYISENFFVSYAKPKKILPMNKKYYFKRDNKIFSSFQSVLLPELLFITRRLLQNV